MKDFIISVCFYHNGELHVQHYGVRDGQGFLTYRYNDAKHFETIEQAEKAAKKVKQMSKRIDEIEKWITIVAPEELDNNEIRVRRVKLIAA